MRVSFDRIEILEELLNFIFLLGEVSFKLKQCSVPKPTIEYFTISEFPLFQLFALLLRVTIVHIVDRLADILSLNHVLLIKFDDQVGAVGRLHLYLLDGLDLDR